MGSIKEPEGIDFIVGSKPSAEKDKREISEIMAHYIWTGRKKKLTIDTKKVISKKNSSVSERCNRTVGKKYSALVPSKMPTRGLSPTAGMQEV